MNIYTILAVIIYFSIVFCVGLWAYLKDRGSQDFILGSRSLSYWVTALAAHASDMSGWLFMGFPAAIYTHGLIEAWTAIGLTVFMLLNWILIAPGLRKYSEQFKSKTLSSFLAEKHNDTYGILRGISAFFCLVFFMFYISANLAALGHLFESIFAVDYGYGITLGAIIVLYTLIGGFTSIAWIDFFQGLFLFAMILLVPAWACMHLPTGITLSSIFEKSGGMSALLPQNIASASTLLMLSCGWGLGYFGQPHIVTKFMGIDDGKNIAKARLIGMSWQVITLTAAIVVGIIGIGFYAPGEINPEYIFINLTKEFFHPFIAGIILCAILASAINVMGAQVLASASVITEDIVKKVLPSHKKNESLYARASSIMLCGAALITAWATSDKAIYDLVYFPWAGLGSAFGPIMLISLHTNIKSWRAAAACVFAGGLVASLWGITQIAIPSMIAGYIAALSTFALVIFIEKIKIKDIR